MSTNIVQDAQEAGLTLKQERYCRAVADGKNLSESGRIAGYESNPDFNPSLPYRLLKRDKIQVRIHELIAEQEYEKDAQSVWRSVLSSDESVHEAGSMKWCNVIDRKLKVIDQIAKLGGWEQAKQVETKQLVLKGSVTDMLPKK